MADAGDVRMSRGPTSAPWLLLATLLLDLSLRGQAFEPTFTIPLQNQTVAIGRDVTFNCEVHHLGGYRVGWVKADTKAIQAIHDHVITHNPRVSVSHAGHSTWSLHIKNVQMEDEGQYMCQINTDPMKSQLGSLSIVIPPDFDPRNTSGDTVLLEGNQLKLRCVATGHPKPTITWHREDGKDIFVRNLRMGLRMRVNCFYGNELTIDRTTRVDMAVYVCVASNGVPPAISKRITVQINFFPLIQVPNQLVGAPLGTDVTLECLIEAFPKPIDYWVRDTGEMIIQSQKHTIKTVYKSEYESRLTLLIKNLQKYDFGTYRCVTKNSLGEVESNIRLYEIQTQQTRNRDEGRKVPGLEDQEDDDQGGSAEREEEEEQSNSVDDQSRGLTHASPGGPHVQLADAQENRIAVSAAPISTASLVPLSLLFFLRI